MTERPTASGGTDDNIEDAEIVESPAVSPVSGTMPTDPLTSAPVPGFDYTDAGVPTLDFVRDRIEKRFGTALGSSELAEAAVPDSVREEQERRREQADDRERLAREKLDEIRRSLGR